MFLGLFKGVDLSQFHCDVCELAKHKCVFFQYVIQELQYLLILFIVMLGDLRQFIIVEIWHSKLGF